MNDNELIWLVLVFAQFSFNKNGTKKTIER